MMYTYYIKRYRKRGINNALDNLHALDNAWSHLRSAFCKKKN